MKIFKAFKCDETISCYFTSEEEAKKFCATENHGSGYFKKPYYYAIDTDDPKFMCGLLRDIDELKDEVKNNRHRHGLP